MENLVRSIGFQWDQARQVLWFHADLTSGAHYDVGFPFAHVAVTFDNKMAELGFVAGNCGSIPSIEGFVTEIAQMNRAANPRLRYAANGAMQRTLAALADQGLHYGTHAHGAVLGSVESEVTEAKAALTQNGTPITTLNIARMVAARRPYSPTNPTGLLTAELIKQYGLSGQKLLDIQKTRTASISPEYAALQKTLAVAREDQKHSGTDKSFGSGVTKALQTAGQTITKTVTAPITTVVKAGTAIAHGQNVGTALKQAGKETITQAVQAARVAGTVASVLPGVGTAASFALRYTTSVADAVAQGKNVIGSLEHSAINAALNSLPGGEVTGALVRTVANVAAAGLEGKNLLKSAAHEVTGAAIGLVPSEAAQKVLQAAADAAIAGQNVLQGAKAAVIQQALNQIPDATARQAVQGVLQGKDPASIVQSVAPSLLAAAAALAPTGGAAALVTNIVGKNPAQILSGASGITAPVRAVAPMGAPRNATEYFPAIGARALQLWARG